MSGREDRLKALLGSLDGVVGTLDQQKVQIINALQSLNNLTSTLNKEKDTIGEALDATGPAVKVLADQHDEPDRHARRAGPPRQGRHPGDQRQQGRRAPDPGGPQPDPAQACARRTSRLAPGLNLLVSLPVPAVGQQDREGRLRQHHRPCGPRLHQPVPQPRHPDAAGCPTWARCSTR
ncbi:hypothetical protein G5V59_05420 [Nocardioides sp. W3-2-3]|nr:hypothetical protein [Nocardioides convexus]